MKKGLLSSIPGKGGDAVGVGTVVGIIDEESWYTVDVSIHKSI